MQNIIILIAAIAFSLAIYALIKDYFESKAYFRMKKLEIEKLRQRVYSQRRREINMAIARNDQSIARVQALQQRLKDITDRKAKTDADKFLEEYKPQVKFAKIKATEEQLAEIGLDLVIDETSVFDIIFEVPTEKIDLWVGVDAPCSSIVYRSHTIIGELTEEYVISTKWLEFVDINSI